MSSSSWRKQVSLAKIEALKRHWLKRIAASPMMLTFRESEGLYYSLQNGTRVPRDVAEALIVEGRVCGDKDSLFGLSQTFRVENASRVQ